MRIKSLLVIAVISAFLIPEIAQAQCSMCRAVLETSGDVKQGEALNSGIVYLMAVPYIVVGVIGIVLYRSRKSARKNKD